MPSTQHHHRATLKQQNKSFKSRHSTKGALKEAAKGKVPRKSPKASNPSASTAQTRLNRRNNAKQAQAIKRQSLVSSTRLFNGVDGAPRIVAVIPLTEDVDARVAVAALAESVDASMEGYDGRLWRLKAERFKTSLQLISVPYRQIYAALDACKVADYVVFVLSSSVEVDPWGDTLLRTLQAQGLPSVVTVLAPTDSLDTKSRPPVLKSLLSFIQYFVPTQTRVFDLHVPADRLNALRAVAEGKPGDVRWREGRAWLVGEEVEWEDGVLKVTGVSRGAALSSKRLIHIPNYGDFQIAKILSAPINRPGKMEVEPAFLTEAGDDGDSLVSTNDPDDMANEQTWPTEEEMQGTLATNEPAIPDAKQGTTPKAVRRVPKGMSEYQAAWIVDESDDEEGGSGSEADDQDMGDDVVEEEEEMEELPVDEDHEMETDSRRSVAFQDLDNEEEAKQLQSWRNRKREEEDDLMFPDELDTPDDVPARTRFQRYRGLRSFRTSPWDPFENLPRDYARIFQFEDYKRTERNVRRRAEEEASVVEPGTRVTVYLRGVPQAAANTTAKSPLLLFALLQHEHKVSVLNFTLQRNTEYDGSVRSKDPLVLCIGPRRLRVNPIYSQHTRGGGKGANNVHKFERYLRHGQTSVATIYGPVVFGKQPSVWLRETEDPQAPHLVAMGTFLNPDTTRVIAKRIILTGHPFKVHKKTATVRYMFFNADDIAYFKPIQLHTKHGRTGHIRESLGTHGYLKAHFDGPINQMDTVCMSLYKRVFPKWPQLYKPASQNADAMEE
ncbi:Bms1-type G domain-containing protein [Mycena indigotica]|uniref:Bms1-type G domain-containing protein n=1 Tax=Mycena indigotica TaxID=2126181 RepID=A0A8H6THJ9_9AGAR|nr:Bms1-type G domain-containing protein [Mycena indigotica]KAF7315865.1 Bms1-type G domain-containing protein [Mycena indigotica]